MKKYKLKKEVKAVLLIILFIITVIVGVATVEEYNNRVTNTNKVNRSIKVIK